jgi:hypothetical protein
VRHSPSTATRSADCARLRAPVRVATSRPPPSLRRCCACKSLTATSPAATSGKVSSAGFACGEPAVPDCRLPSRGPGGTHVTCCRRSGYRRGRGPRCCAGRLGIHRSGPPLVGSADSAGCATSPRHRDAGTEPAPSSPSCTNCAATRLHCAPSLPTHSLSTLMALPELPMPHREPSRGRHSVATRHCISAGTHGRLSRRGAAVSCARERLGDEAVTASLPALQKFALSAGAREQLSARRGLLAKVRSQVSALAPERESEEVRIERLRPRSVLTLIAGTVAAYVVVGQLGHVNLRTVFDQARPSWLSVAVAGSLATYVATTPGLHRRGAPQAALLAHSGPRSSPHPSQIS